MLTAMASLRGFGTLPGRLALGGKGWVKIRRERERVVWWMGSLKESGERLGEGMGERGETFEEGRS